MLRSAVHSTATATVVDDGLLQVARAQAAHHIADPDTGDCVVCGDPTPCWFQVTARARLVEVGDLP